MYWTFRVSTDFFHISFSETMISIDHPTNDGDHDERKSSNVEDVGTSSHLLLDIPSNEEDELR